MNPTLRTLRELVSLSAEPLGWSCTLTASISILRAAIHTRLFVLELHALEHRLVSWLKTLEIAPPGQRIRRGSLALWCLSLRDTATPFQRALPADFHALQATIVRMNVTAWLSLFSACVVEPGRRRLGRSPQALQPDG